MTFANIKPSFIKSFRGFSRMLPMIFGVALLASLFVVVFPKSFYQKIFTGNTIFDPIIGASIGSVVAGQPVASYIIGGELLKQGVSLIAVIAFILAWVTVGIVQLPAESLVFGKKFAIYRNLLSFISALIIALLATITLSIL